MSMKKTTLPNSNVYDIIQKIQACPEDREVQEKLVIQYEDLVRSLARKYAFDQANFEDLYQVGMIGLIYAAKRFDLSYGRPFEAYAIPTIKGEIKRYLRDKTWSISVPRRVKELGPRIQRAVDQLFIHLERMPTLAELANHLSLEEKELSELLAMMKNYHTLSVDFKYQKKSDEQLVTLLDIIEVQETYYDHVERKLLLESVFSTLETREQEVLTYLFYDHRTQDEVGKILGVSQMQVSRIQRKALSRLRKALTYIDGLDIKSEYC